MKRKFHVAHQVPGRIRIKVPLGKRNPALLDEIKQIFVTMPGIDHVAVNPTTGSVLLFYERSIHPEVYERFVRKYEQHAEAASAPLPSDIDDLARTIQVEGELLAAHSHMARSVVDVCKYLDYELRVATGNAIDLKLLLALGLAGFTFLQVGASASTPMWVTLAIFAFNHFAEMHPVGPTTP